MSRDTLEQLLGLFNLQSKREVERYCRTLVITSEDLAGILIAGRVTGLGPLVYAAHFDEKQPPSLRPTQAQLNAVGASGTGRLEGQALKTMRKVGQMFIDRRMLAVHLFYTPSKRYWHMFHFDQRDTDIRKPHWKHGPHIHYSQDLFTDAPLDEIWQRATAESPEFPWSLHIRYDYHHNRLRD